MAKATTIATFPPGFFLENIVATRAGGAFITTFSRRELYYISTLEGEGSRAPTLIHKFDHYQWATGIVEAPKDPNVFWVLSTDFIGQGTNPTSHLYVIDVKNAASGDKPQQILTFPNEARALNGICALSESVLLVTDSFASCIWRVDLDLSNTPPTATASTWLSDPTMAGELTLPDFQPGANGIKYSSATGRVYYTSTQQRLFCEVKVQNKTFEPEGNVKIVARGMQGDDLIVDDSDVEQPVAYVATHRDNTILRIPLDSRQKKRTDEDVTVVAEGTEQVDTMLGPTAGSWAPDQVGKCAYFTTDGGLKNIIGGLVRSAKVVRVKL